MAFQEKAALFQAGNWTSYRTEFPQYIIIFESKCTQLPRTEIGWWKFETIFYQKIQSSLFILFVFFYSILNLCVVYLYNNC